jgi:hypothetical protein
MGLPVLTFIIDPLRYKTKSFCFPALCNKTKIIVAGYLFNYKINTANNGDFRKIS